MSKILKFAYSSSACSFLTAFLGETFPLAFGFGRAAELEDAMVDDAAMANLDVIERENLVDNSDRVGGYMQGQLRARLSDHPLVGEVRGRALIAAVELVKNKATKEEFDLGLKVGPQMIAACMDEGLVIRSLMGTNSTAFSPPLVVNESDIDEVLDRYGRALDRVAGDLKKDGHWTG